eukprot:CAMPEP_0177774762 /NCGR_PEP_ID=MMETSP0491_2-20121128/13710_1 /TAXON_ID=63592 /ORGANISM="Tetraselmis chuii, Strain PLY429" /LENGTH=376 /DNA_ID=CAMNT_0019293223 /DNA_START=1 /DNA_END=1131 /DNA_ORIENTATION=+
MIDMGLLCPFRVPCLRLSKSDQAASQQRVVRPHFPVASRQRRKPRSIRCDYHSDHGEGRDGTPLRGAFTKGEREESTLLEERGCRFVSGAAFYRPESAQARDLAVLAALAYQRRTGRRFRVLDACSGSGVRGARYLHQAGVQSVWCNDYNSSNGGLLSANLRGVDDTLRTLTEDQADTENIEEAALEGLRGYARQGIVESVSTTEDEAKSPQTWRVSHYEALRLLTSRWLAEDYYDLVDVDSFGAQGSFTSAALGAVKHGGLLYLTCTDGLAASGRAPSTALIEYGTYTHPTPFANEQGLRMLIGSAVMEAARRGQTAKPIFSLFSAHGPVFRVMFEVRKGNDRTQLKDINFIAHCPTTLANRIVPFADLGCEVSR